jgi:hypothetical protein
VLGYEPIYGKLVVGLRIRVLDTGGSEERLLDAELEGGEDVDVNVLRRGCRRSSGTPWSGQCQARRRSSGRHRRRESLGGGAVGRFLVEDSPCIKETGSLSS